MNDIYFTPGPAELYYTIEDHVKSAFKEQVPSISHRSKAFQNIYQETTENLKQLLNLPEGYHVFFTGSATEIWERLIQNCVGKHSYHFVNGSFSNRFYDAALKLNKSALASDFRPGTAPVVELDNIPEYTELIACTLNETSTGVTQPLEDIYRIRDHAPDKLLVVDAVSIMPYPDIDYNKIDSLFFSVQKGFGLPAGLGVWLVNDRCIDKARKLEASKVSIGTYHSLPSLLEKGRKNQTPETPNTLGIYLLGKVCGDMLEKGINQIRQEMNYKAALMYATIDQHPVLNPSVEVPEHRSRTVIVADSGAYTERFHMELRNKNMIIGSGYGSNKSNQIRIANFPTHSKEQFELLVDHLNKITD